MTIPSVTWAHKTVATPYGDASVTDVTIFFKGEHYGSRLNFRASYDDVVQFAMRFPSRLKGEFLP